MSSIVPRKVQFYKSSSYRIEHTFFVCGIEFYLNSHVLKNIHLFFDGEPLTILIYPFA